MPLPSLESLTPALDAVCRDVLGETLIYTPEGGSAGNVTAHVDWRDQIDALNAGHLVQQDITGSIVKTDIPAKPSGAVRISSAKVPGVVFRPSNVRNDASGTHWDFELVVVP